MDDAKRDARSRAAAIDWYQERARYFRGVAKLTPYIDLLAIGYRIDMRQVATILMNAAASEQIPQALREDA